MSPRLKILLVVSLALNLFALGGVVGAVVMGARMGLGRAPASFAAGPGSAFRAPGLLGPEDAPRLRARLREAAEAGAADRRTAREARRAAVRMIGVRDYDGAAVAAAFARARAADEAARARIETALAEGLSSVSPDARIELAERMARPPRDRRRDRDRDRRGPDGPPPS